MRKYILVFSICINLFCYASELPLWEKKAQEQNEIAQEFIKSKKEPLKQEVNLVSNSLIPGNQRLEDGILSEIVDYAQDYPIKIISKSCNSQWKPDACESIDSFSWSPDGTKFAIVFHGLLRVYDINNWQIIKEAWATYGDGQGQLYFSQWSPNGETLAVTAAKNGIHIFDMINLESGPKILENNMYVNSIAWLNDIILIAGGGYGRLNVWDITDCELKLEHPIKGYEIIYNMELSPYQTKLMTNSDYGVTIYDLHDLNVLKFWPRNEYTNKGTIHNWYKAIKWSPDEEWLLLCQGNIINICETDTWQIIHTIENISKVTSLAFSPDGTKLAISLDNGIINIYNFPELQIVKTWYKNTYGYKNLHWSPDNETIAGVSNLKVEIWSLN